MIFMDSLFFNAWWVIRYIWHMKVATGHALLWMISSLKGLFELWWVSLGVMDQLFYGATKGTQNTIGSQDIQNKGHCIWNTSIQKLAKKKSSCLCSNRLFVYLRNPLTDKKTIYHFFHQFLKSFQFKKRIFWIGAQNHSSWIQF